MNSRACPKLVAALFSCLIVVVPARAQDWQWHITPYAWLSEVGLDASINDQEVLEREADLSDVLDLLDFTLQINLEGQKDRHGVLFDLYYADLGDDDRRFTLPAPAEGTIVAKGELEMTILEAGGLWNPRADGTGFTLLYGARVIDIDEEIDARFDLPGPLPDPSRRYSASTTLVDGMVGARFVAPFADRWSFVLRADVSAGGSELTWNSTIGLGWSFGAGERYTILGGYRYMRIEFEEDDARAELELQNKLGGFIAGLRFAF